MIIHLTLDTAQSDEGKMEGTTDIGPAFTEVLFQHRKEINTILDHRLVSKTDKSQQGKNGDLVTTGLRAEPLAWEPVVRASHDVWESFQLLLQSNF